MTSALTLGVPGRAVPALAPGPGTIAQEDAVTARQDEDAATGRAITFADVARWPRRARTRHPQFNSRQTAPTLTYLYSADNSLVQELWPTPGHRAGVGSPRRAGPRSPLRGRLHAYRGSPPRAHPPEHLRRDQLRLGRYRQVLMARRQGEVLVRSGLEGTWRALPGSHVWIDPRLSPDETRVAFALDGESARL